MFTAALDTSVLWPSLQRDFLLSLAVEGLYRPVWSSAVLDELEYCEARKIIKRERVSPDEAARRALNLIREMRRAFDDSEIHGWEALEGSYGLPDPDDGHVVAAAVLAGAGVIVAGNLKDFPATRLPRSLEAVDAPDFVSATVSLSPLRALAAVRTMSGRSGRFGPTLSVEDILKIVDSRYEMTEAVQLLRAAGAGPSG